MKLYISTLLICLWLPGINPVYAASDPDSLIVAGKDFFENGQFAEAQAVLEGMIVQHPKSFLAHYWLGMALYEQKKDKEALDNFKRSVKLDKKFVDGHLGVGRVYLRTKNRRLDARSAFKRAERIEPDNADVQDFLGLTYVSTFGNRREYGIDARPYFRKAIELDPEHPDAYYHLGLTYEESPGKNYREAIPHYFNQLIATPTHSEALQHLANCAIKTQQYEEGAIMLEQIAVLPGSEDNSMIETIRAQLFAMALDAERDYDKAYERYESFVAALDPDEKQLYTDLRFVAPPDLAKAYLEAPEDEKPDIWRKFWAIRDPDPTTLVNERLVEHYRRVSYARTHFASAQYPWDQRGEIYIRYGEPDNRQNAGGTIFPTSDARVDAIREINQRLRYRPNTRGFLESWVYVPYGIELFFSDQFGNGIYKYPPMTTNPRTNQFHPATIASELIARVPEAYRFDYGGEIMDFIFDAVTYRGKNGQTEVEVAYSVPARQLGYVGDGLGEQTWFKSAFVLRDRELRRVSNTANHLGPIDRPQNKISKKFAKSVRKTAAFSLSAPPGFYRSAIAVRDSASKRVGIYEAPLTVWNYDSNAINLSDIRLANSIIPQSDPGPFVRHKFKIMPNPMREFQRNQPVYLYYEVYNLSKDENDRTSYRTNLEISAKKKKMHAVWRFLSGFGRLLRDSDEPQSVLLSYEGEGRLQEEHLFTSIDTGQSPSGDYTITLTITDLHSGQSVTKVKEFVVTDDGRQPVEEDDPSIDMKQSQ